jgi:ATP phosphoribosyltransferase
MIKDTLILAIPSKGRLMEAAADYFAKAGLKLERSGGTRNYSGTLKGVDGVEVRFLSASEIAGALITGEVHLGITGRDLLHEQTPTPDERVAPLAALGFGHADVVIAVPEAWIDVDNMADLGQVCTDFRARHHRPLRVATKYFGITRAFFADNGIIDYRIVESLGATEGAPAAGSAEVIVDITSTGATLTANKLKILEDGVILNSEAFLTASLGADWAEGAMEIAQDIFARLDARNRANEKSEIRFDATALSAREVESLQSETKIEFPYGQPAPGEQECVAHVFSDRAFDLVGKLQKLECQVISVRDLKYIYTNENPLMSGLKSALTKAGKP